jgi:hypothetical protein
MKPFTSGTVITAWLIRLTLVWFVYRNYFQPFTSFDLHSFHFYVSAAYLLFSVLIVIGGFFQKTTLSVLSGLIVFVLPIVQLIRVFPEDLGSVLLVYLIPLAAGFYFFTYGNN